VQRERPLVGTPDLRTVPIHANARQAGRRVVYYGIVYRDPQRRVAYT
jgi:hypothetical protein